MPVQRVQTRRRESNPRARLRTPRRSGRRAHAGRRRTGRRLQGRARNRRRTCARACSRCRSRNRSRRPPSRGAWPVQRSPWRCQRGAQHRRRPRPLQRPWPGREAAYGAPDGQLTRWRMQGARRARAAAAPRSIPPGGAAPRSPAARARHPRPLVAQLGGPGSAPARHRRSILSNAPPRSRRRGRAQTRGPDRAWGSHSTRSPVQPGAQLAGSQGLDVSYGAQDEQLTGWRACRRPHPPCRTTAPSVAFWQAICCGTDASPRPQAGTGERWDSSKRTVGSPATGRSRGSCSASSRRRSATGSTWSPWS